jgi:hypothetical protein
VAASKAAQIVIRFFIVFVLLIKEFAAKIIKKSQYLIE